MKKVGRYVFLGWESIQARACGFKSKAEFAKGMTVLPAHCNPLSRKVIRNTLETLERTRFFVRFRFSVGDRGGRYAYSFRHATREDLAKSVESSLTEANKHQKRVIENRTSDRALSIKIRQGQIRANINKDGPERGTSEGPKAGPT